MKFQNNYLSPQSQAWARDIEAAIESLSKRDSVVRKDIQQFQRVTSNQITDNANSTKDIGSVIDDVLESYESFEDIQVNLEETVQNIIEENARVESSVDNALYVSAKQDIWIGDSPPIGQFAGENLALSPQATTDAGFTSDTGTYNVNLTTSLNPPPGLTRGWVRNFQMQDNVGSDQTLFELDGIDRRTAASEDRYVSFWFGVAPNAVTSELSEAIREVMENVTIQVQLYHEVEFQFEDDEPVEITEEVISDWQAFTFPINFIDETIEYNWVNYAPQEPIPAGVEVKVRFRFLGDAPPASFTGLFLLSGIQARTDRRPMPSDFFDGSFPMNDNFEYHWSGTPGESTSYRTAAVHNEHTLWIDTTLNEEGRPGNTPMVWDPDTNQWVESTDDKIVQAAEDAAQAAEDAAAALDAATSKNKITHAVTAPIGDGEAVGDMWMMHQPDIDGPVSGWWTWTGANWVPMELRNEVIANLDAGKITTGILDANRIAANSITTRKLQIGDFNNYWLDPRFIRIDDLEELTQVVIDDSFTPPAGGRVMRSVGTWAGYAGAPLGEVFGTVQDVKPGDEFLITYDRRNADGGSVASIHMNLYQINRNNGSLSSMQVLETNDNALSDDWTRTTRIVRANSEFAAWARPILNKPSSVTALWSNVSILRRNSADLIVDGAIVADKIAANAVTTPKLYIGNMSNIFLDPKFEKDYSPTWASNNGGIEKNGTGTQSGEYYEQNRIEVNPGDQFMFKAKASVVSGPVWGSGNGITVYIQRRNINGALVGSERILDWTPTTVGDYITGNFEVPNNIYYLDIGFYTQSVVGSGTRVRIEDMQVMRRASGELIVDGAIIAAKIASDAITTDKLDSNAITAKHTITGATIQTLAAANRGIKITDNQLRAFNTSGTQKVLISGSTGEITVTDGTFTGSTFRTAASGARTEMTSDGVQVFNSANQAQVQMGHGVDTGLAIRQGDNMVPLAPYAFGSYTNGRADWVHQHNGSGMAWWGNAGWSNNRTITSNRYLVIVQLAANVTPVTGQNPTASPYARVVITLRNLNEDIVTTTTYALDTTASFKSYLGDIYASSNYWNTFYNIAEIDLGTAPIGSTFRASMNGQTLGRYRYAFTGFNLILRPI